jgi:hypothetical protein
MHNPTVTGHRGRPHGTGDAAPHDRGAAAQVLEALEQAGAVPQAADVQLLDGGVLVVVMVGVVGVVGAVAVMVRGVRVVVVLEVVVEEEVVAVVAVVAAGVVVVVRVVVFVADGGGGGLGGRAPRRCGGLEEEHGVGPARRVALVLVHEGEGYRVLVVGQPAGDEPRGAG